MRFEWKTGLHLAAAAVLLVAGQACSGAGVEGSFDKTLTVSGPVEMEVQTGSGSIEVRTGSTGSVRVVGRIRAGNWLGGSGDVQSRVRRIEANPPIDQTGNTIRIGREREHDLFNNISISYELTVPADCRLRASTGSGSQTVEGIHGPVEVKTGSGSIAVSRISSAVSAQTGSGEIELDGIGGSAQAQTGSGSIRGKGLGSSVTAHTGSGGIEMDLTGEGDADVRTSSGSLRVAGARSRLLAESSSGNVNVEGNPKADWKVHASSGSVTLKVPASAGFELDARSGSGGIHVGRPITMQGDIDKHHVQGKVGNGGPRLEVSTASGSVHIE